MPLGKKHDGRAPDYDDWQLNGDLILWNPILESALELSSMGIRVNEASLLKQLEEAQQEARKTLDYHQLLLSGALPLTIGGGIGSLVSVCFPSEGSYRRSTGFYMDR